MNEFKNRIVAQRHVLNVVNSKQWPAEELFGLSNKAIERWAVKNHLDADSELAQLVKLVSSKLFFLANRSQEQISDQYRAVSSDIYELSNRIKVLLDRGG